MEFLPRQALPAGPHSSARKHGLEFDEAHVWDWLDSGDYGRFNAALQSRKIRTISITGARGPHHLPTDASRAVELVLSLPIRIDFADLRTLNASRLLAREYDLSAYDASYLELAQREGLPLATMDQTLSMAAKRCGVPVLPGSAD